MKLYKRLLSGVLAAAMTLGAAAMLPVGAANVTFTDVSGHWAWTNGQIPYLVEKGVLNGYEQSNGTYIFKPDGEVKRSEFIKMLNGVFGLTETTSINYTDVPKSEWYYDSFRQAAAQGYILDYGTTANPSGYITREEATALLARYLDLPANEKAETSVFADTGSIASGYLEYVLRATYAGIINGIENNGKMYFKPQKTLTRAEALTILYKAAGCIFNDTAYGRSGSAHSTNNVITKANVTIHDVRFTGRNIISEGADNGTITFADCDINGTLYIRGGADVKFDDCTVENVVVYGGGDISIVGGSEIDSITLEATSNISIGSSNKLGTLSVEYGANDVRVSGDGKLNKAIIKARDFSSTMMPIDFEIGNNLTAIFSADSYTGSSAAQAAFEMDPFTSGDDDSYYINVLPAMDGKVYYYYTSLGNTPSAAAFDSYYDASEFAGSFEVKKGEPISAATFATASVEKFESVVIQLRYGDRKYAPVKIDNHRETTTGFKTEPYLADATTIKFQTNSSATLLWFYADDGKQLSPVEFLTAYNNKESALKGETAVTSVKSFTCTLKEKYLENYSYVAFMLKGANNIYHVPVIVSVGDDGFSTTPVVSTPGVIPFTTSVSGILYYYYTDSADLPTPDNFKGEYNAARYADNMEISRGVSDELKYDVDHIKDYPYLVLSIRNKDKEYLQPVLVDINFTTGFEDAPTVKNSSQIRFRTEEDGEIWFYYTKMDKAPTIADFRAAYDDHNSKYKGKMDVNDMFETLDYKASYAATYPYMAIMFVNEDGEAFSPVLLALNATLKTGFTIAPYAEGGEVYFKAEEAGEVWYFYTSDSETVAAADFYDYYINEPSSRRGTKSVSGGKLTSITLDEDILERYPYLVLAYTDETTRQEPDFSFPFVLDVAQSELSKADTGLEVGTPSDDEVRVVPHYDGKLYYYCTNDADDVPTSKNNFKAAYDDAANRDSLNVKKDEREYLKFKDYDYIIAALRVDDEYLNYVVIHHKDGVEEDNTSDDSGLDYDRDSYGITCDVSRDSVYVTATVEDGEIQLYSRTAGSFNKVGDAIRIDRGDTEEIEFGYDFGNEIFDILGMMGMKPEFYVQFTADDGTVYKARKVEIN